VRSEKKVCCILESLYRHHQSTAACAHQAGENQYMHSTLNGTVVSTFLVVGLAVAGCDVFKDNQPTVGQTTGGATIGGVTSRGGIGGTGIDGSNTLGGTGDMGD
jgi:hypothetical protein